MTYNDKEKILSLANPRTLGDSAAKAEMRSHSGWVKGAVKVDSHSSIRYYRYNVLSPYPQIGTTSTRPVNEYKEEEP